jgi:SWI/SNF-related matrix-associated actin-dependent regulator 1 of chromatin subfamily A
VFLSRTRWAFDLGKTIQAIGVINAVPEISDVLIVATKTLLTNWRNELRKWLTRPMSVGIATAKRWPDTQIILVNYDILFKLKGELDSKPWDLLVCDECHYLKNLKAQRTRAVFGDSRKRSYTPAVMAERTLMLTGTPILNKPVELWPVIHALAPETFPSYWEYTRRYCGAFQSKWGWDVSGATNLDELQEKLRTSCMVRRLKKDVLKELPAKIRQIVELSADGNTKALKAEAKAKKAIEARLALLTADLEAARSEEEYRAAVKKMKQTHFGLFEELSAVRRETAVSKIPQVLEYLYDAVEASGKVVVFAHHHDVIDGIAAGLASRGIKAVTITGRTKDRQTPVDVFQTDPTVKVFIGGIRAAGVGITLTAASHVIFAELDWTPGWVTQAEDRCHRIGATGCVLVQHLVLEQSIDAHVVRLLVEKQEVAEKALDLKPEEGDRFDIDFIKALVSDEQIAARRNHEQEEGRRSEESLHILQEDLPDSGVLRRGGQLSPPLLDVSGHTGTTTPQVRGVDGPERKAPRVQPPDSGLSLPRLLEKPAGDTGRGGIRRHGRILIQILRGKQMFEKIIALLDRFVCAVERLAAANEKMADGVSFVATADAPTIKPCEGQQTIAAGKEHGGSADTGEPAYMALVRKLGWNPIEDRNIISRYTAEKQEVLKAILDETGGSYGTSTTGAELHQRVLDAFPTEEEKASRPAEPEGDADAEDMFGDEPAQDDDDEFGLDDEPQEPVPFEEFKERLIKWVAGKAEHRAKVKAALDNIGAENVSAVPEETRGRILAELGA